MNFFRVLEVAIFVLIDFLPNLLLAVLPFRKFLRYSNTFVIINIVGLYVLLIFSRMLATYKVEYATIMSIIWILIYLLFYCINFTLELKKLLFVLLIILNYGSFVAIVYFHISFRILEKTENRPYSLLSSIILALIMLISYPLIYWLIDKKVKPLVVFQINNRIWKYLWMVPATYCLSYYYNLYTNGGVSKYSERLSNVVFAVIFNLGGLFVIYLLCCLLKESNDSLQLKEENYMLSMQSIQYENLKTRIEETRKIRHDLRQILNVISACLQKNEITHLKEYVMQYTESLPSETQITYCEDYSLNALLVYYAGQARNNGIKFEANVDYLKNSNILNSDISILFGNLLENSLEACSKQKGGTPFILVNVKNTQGSIVIAIDNSYGNKIVQSGNTFLSSKGNRIGVGISSVIKIAEKYHGTAKFEHDDNTFYASVILSKSIS